jgi:hypothetical protein
MKKILLSTIILTSFALSLILVQISCKKEVIAQVTSNTTQQNKILFLKQFYAGSGINYDYAEIWTAGYDGSAPKKINITLPTNMVIAMVEPKISPDGKTMFFDAVQTNGTTQTGGWSIYACNIDGSNVHQVIPVTDKSYVISAAY